MNKFVIKTNKKGCYVDFEYRKQVDGKNYRKYKRCYLDSDLTKTKQTQQAKLLYADFITECEEEIKLNVNELSSSMTLSSFIDVYLDYLKNNCSQVHWYGFKIVSETVKEMIGNVKLKDLTPVIIQQFYDYVAKMKRKEVAIFPKDNFNNIIAKYDIKGQEIFRLNKSHKKYIALAKRGEKVGERWAIIFSNYLNLPFDKLFKKVEIETDYSYVYKKKRAVFLKACLSEAKKKLLIKENYAKSEYTTFIKNPEPNKELDILKEEDFFKLYNYVLKLDDIVKKTFFVIMLNTGARKEEVLGLKWSKIDLIKGELEFSTTVTYVSYSNVIINENKTKNVSSNRKLSLSDETISVLTEYKKYYDKLYLDDTEGFIFKKNDGTIVHPCTINVWLNKILKQAGLEHHTVHSLRHSYTSLMINHLPLADISKRIGHSQISTTLNFYTHQITSQSKSKNLKTIIKQNYTDEIISALNLLKQHQILNEAEYQSKKELTYKLFEK